MMPAQCRSDLRFIRQFLLGVLGWRPADLRDATLEDIADAWRGYAAANGLAATAPATITARFLRDMMQRYPDQTEGEDDARDGRHQGRTGGD